MRSRKKRRGTTDTTRALSDQRHTRVSRTPPDCGADATARVPAGARAGNVRRARRIASPGPAGTDSAPRRRVPTVTARTTPPTPAPPRVNAETTTETGPPPIPGDRSEAGPDVVASPAAPGMTRGAWARLAVWKARGAALRAAERVGGLELIRRRAAAWEREGARAAGSDAGALGRWLARPGAGVFWMGDGHGVWTPETWTPADRRIADAAVGGVFDVLGSGPVELGTTPAWRRDLYTGREWPLEPSGALRIVRGDGSDIRTVWELSRGYQLLALARGWHATGSPAYAETAARHLDSWMAQNPLGLGPHWASPMDVGIRATNWIVALHAFAGCERVPAGVWRRVLRNLYESGLYLERHLEWHPVYRGNHFVANGVGLVYLGALFRDTRDGERWLGLGGGILREEIERQVGPDGVSFESALAYHRLVTELFAYGGELVRLNTPDALPAAYEERLRAMYRFVAAYLPPSGEAPMLGDADDGRLHAVSATGWLEPRRHALGLPARYWPDAAGPGCFPQGGFYVLREGAHHAVVRCGAVGICGAGSHDHNDLLSPELVLGGVRVLADSGTYAYTRDLEARHAFRATAAHSVVQLGGEEQNPIAPGRPWRVLEDRARARCLEWYVGAEEQRFVGEHRGFAHRPSGAVCRRTLRLRPAEAAFEMLDEVAGRGLEAVAWRLHFARGPLRQEPASGSWHRFRFGEGAGVEVAVRLPPGLHLRIAASRASDRYGEHHLRPVLVAEGDAPLPLTIETRFRAAR